VRFCAHADDVSGWLWSESLGFELSSQLSNKAVSCSSL